MKNQLERRFVTFHVVPKEARNYRQKTPQYREFDRVPAISIRAEQEKRDLPQLEGYAAMFDVDTVIPTWFGDFRERIAKGAFARAIREKQDVRALRNHDPDNILGRTTAGTLRLREDSTGLMIEVDPPDTTVARDTIESIRRGDITGQSFAFIARKVTWINGENGEPDLRIIEDVDLYDVGPVTYPAYPETSIDLNQVSDIYEGRLREIGKPPRKAPTPRATLVPLSATTRDGDDTPEEQTAVDAEEPKEGTEAQEEQAPPSADPAPVVVEDPAPPAATADDPVKEQSSIRRKYLLALTKLQRERNEHEINLLTE